MHKTSSYNGDEKDGFMQAAENERLQVLDLVSVRRSGTPYPSRRRVAHGARYGDAVRRQIRNCLLKGTVP